jgi:hypothetical protein
MELTERFRVGFSKRASSADVIVFPEGLVHSIAMPNPASVFKSAAAPNASKHSA